MRLNPRLEWNEFFYLQRNGREQMKGKNQNGFKMKMNTTNRLNALKKRLLNEINKRRK